MMLVVTQNKVSSDKMCTYRQLDVARFSFSSVLHESEVA
jgi:hypothetical protein